MLEKAPTPEEETAAARASSGKGGKKKAEELKKAEGEKKAVAEAEAAKAGEEDMFTDLLASFVVDQPQLKGGKIAGKDGKKGKK